MENEKLNSFTDKIRDIAQNIVNKDYAQREKDLVFSSEGWKLLGELKLQGAAVPENKSGAGFTYEELSFLMSNLGYYSVDNGLNFSIAAHALACVLPISKYGNAPQIKLLAEFCNGHKILTNAITEKHGGSDVFNMHTKAVKQNGGYLINGLKSYCSNAPIADYVVVYASTDETKGFLGGITAFLVPMNSKGVKKLTPFEKMGLRTCVVCEIEFNDVLVQGENVLGKPGSGGIIFQESMIWEKIFIAAMQTGTIKRWLGHMYTHLKQRELMKHQAMAHQLARARIQYEACKAMVAQAVKELESNSLPNQLTQAASVKYFVSNTITDLASVYLNIFAGDGYKTGSGVEVQVRDAMAATIYSGTSEVQLNMIASAILK